MKIYTKTGDEGNTSLWGGQRLPKSDLRIDTYGTVDELNAWIGWVRDHEANGGRRERLLHIQNNLFSMGSLLASKNQEKQPRIPTLTENDILPLEAGIDSMDKTLPPLRNFILPGGHPAVSACHVARTVCRRAERLAVALHHKEGIDPLFIKYLNRLSDYLFVLSRQIAHELNISETPWKPQHE